MFGACPKEFLTEDMFERLKPEPMVLQIEGAGP
jgi:hypothetical protein